MKLPFNKLCRGRSDFALRNSSSYYRRLPLEPLEERRLLAAGEFLGPNLIFNGSFDADEGGSDDLAGWITANGGVQWEIEGGDGVARVTSLHSGTPIDPNLPTGKPAAKIRQGVLVSPNTTYRLEFDINTRQATTATSSTDIKLQVFEGDPNDSVSFLFDRVYRDIDNGRQFVEIVTGANVDDDTITFQFIASRTNRDFTIDNVSMRELIDVPIDGGLGPEILINGTFDQADQLSSWEFANGGVDWVLESSPDDGAARITSENTDPDVPPGTIAAKIRQGFSTEPETTYQLEFDLVSRQLSGQTRSDVKLQLFKGSQANSFWFDEVFSQSANIHYVVPFTTEAGDDAITVQWIANRTARSFKIDNVSVREAISIPREVGVELLANGSFDVVGVLAGWTASGDPGTVTWDNGAARVNGTTGDASIEQTIRTVKNAIHLVSFELNVATGQARVQVLDGTGGILASDSLGSGQHSFVVTSTDKILTVRAQASAGGNFTIDDVSIQITELPPDPNIGNFIINGSFDEDGGGSNNLANWEFPNGGVRWELDGPPFQPQIIPDDGVARITSVHPGTLIDPNTPDGAAAAKIRQVVQVKTNTTYRLEFDIISRLVVTEISTTSIKLQVFRAGTTSPLLLAVTLDKNDNGHQA
ncbi:MAG: DUF642 domain-containing protein, partial [Planctomycetes bacterium]|nr:DUF642 domain-containing protein [Planctomycetota bacterium]